MEKLEVGEYVRTKDGIIAKVKNIICKGYVIKSLEGCIILDNENESIVNQKEVKHSKDITDLIQVGDIIEVHFPVRNKIRKIYVDEYFENSMVLNGITSKNLILKTILTKEMFEANCYKVEEE